MSLSRRIGLIVILVVVAFGSFCMFDLYRTLNIKNIVIGYFKHSDDIVQISDFEYDIKSLLFTNSGNNENEYFAEIKGKPVSDYDNTKSYTVAINGIRANRVYDTTNYVNTNFTNIFYSTRDTELLTDTLNIKVNFYTEGTKIIFVTQNGETAVSLWNSYIQKNGFKLTIIEDNYTPSLNIQTAPTHNIYYHDLQGNVINSYTNMITYMTYREFYLREPIINSTVYDGWLDSTGTLYVPGVMYHSTSFSDVHFYIYQENSTETLINYYINDDIYTTQPVERNTEISLLEYEPEADYLFFGWFYDEPVGDLKEAQNVTRLYTGNKKIINLYGKSFRRNAKNIPGYSDSTITINLDFQFNYTGTSPIGVLVVEDTDIDLGTTRTNTYTLGYNGSRSLVLTGMRYCDYKLEFILMRSFSCYEDGRYGSENSLIENFTLSNGINKELNISIYKSSATGISS